MNKVENISHPAKCKQKQSIKTAFNDGRFLHISSWAAIGLPTRYFSQRGTSAFLPTSIFDWSWLTFSYRRPTSALLRWGLITMSAIFICKYLPATTILSVWSKVKYCLCILILCHNTIDARFYKPWTRRGWLLWFFSSFGFIWFAFVCQVTSSLNYAQTGLGKRNIRSILRLIR